MEAMASLSMTEFRTIAQQQDRVRSQRETTLHQKYLTLALLDAVGDVVQHLRQDLIDVRLILKNLIQRLACIGADGQPPPLELGVDLLQDTHV